MSSILLNSLAVVFFLLMIGALFFAPWVPTRKRDLDRIYNLIHPTPDDVFYDLGCGDGRVALYFASRGIRSYGFEISPIFYALSVVNKWMRNKELVTFSFRSFFGADLSNATIVYFFGFEHFINHDPRLRQKLLQELRPGTRIVSYLFSVDWLEPIAVDKPGKEDLTVYVYEIGS